MVEGLDVTLRLSWCRQIGIKQKNRVRRQAANGVNVEDGMDTNSSHDAQPKMQIHAQPTPDFIGRAALLSPAATWLLAQP